MCSKLRIGCVVVADVGSEGVWLGGLGRTKEFDDRLLGGPVIGRAIVCSVGDTNDVVGLLFLVMFPVSVETEDIDGEP